MTYGKSVIFPLGISVSSTNKTDRLNIVQSGLKHHKPFLYDIWSRVNSVAPEELSVQSTEMFVNADLALVIHLCPLTVLYLYICICMTIIK